MASFSPGLSYSGLMQLAGKSFYKALVARDARFDGLFFVGVTSTGIYCRPICPTRTPKESNCRFYRNAQEAEQAGFRPCLRCRPELAPGQAPVDSSQRLAQLIVQRIEEDTTEKCALEAIARDFELSSRQIRRIIQKELGVPPIQLLLTRRLLLAKQLLTETKLSVIEIAFASGFGSLRRFNDAFARRYSMPPTRLRRKAIEGTPAIGEAVTSTLQLSYRPPYDWPGILTFLKARELKGVEWVTETFYARTVQLGRSKGWVKITQAENKNALMLEFTHGLTPVLPALLNRLRGLFDLNARPEIIAKHFAKDKIIGPWVKLNPGMRVPGAFNGFEMGLRAILGQQVTVKAATTVAGRLVAALGEAMETPFAELNRLTPTAATIAKTPVDTLARLGIIATRCQSILALAKAQASGAFPLDGGNHYDPEATIARLTELPGIGSWTAHYIAMRVLRWPDAFSKDDIAVRNNLGHVTARQAEVMSQPWRPWRSYAVLHIWRNSPRSTKAAKAHI